MYNHRVLGRRRRRKLTVSPSDIAFISLLVLLFSQIGCVSASFFNFGQKRFNYEGLIDAGALGLENIEGQIVAFGDVNGDSAMDVFALSSDGKKLDVYLWNHDAFSFQLSQKSQIKSPDSRRIVNVVPADFTYTGSLDVLLMLEAGSNGEIGMALHKSRAGDGFEALAVTPTGVFGPQPVALDATGDMRIDLLGYTSVAKDQLSLLKNVYSERNTSQLFRNEGAPFSYDSGVLAEPICRLAEPHSSAFIDLDGDCLADLFLVCHQSSTSRLSYQIWIAKKSFEGNATTYHFAKGGTLPEGTGALSFADMDRDGTIDVVFPSCDRSECFINIAYNKQMPLCSEKRGGWFGIGPGDVTKDGHAESCRDPEANLCVADPQFSFDFTISDSNDQLARIPVKSIMPERKILLMDNLLSTSIPLPLSLGDYNKDGYPDMAIITIPSRGSRDDTHLRLLESLPCNLKGAALPGCPSDPTKRVGKRTFGMMKTGTEAIDGMNNVRSVSFIDLAEDGSLDMLLQRTSKGSQNQREITLIQNNFFYDAFMLKVMTSNGACASYCETRTESGARLKPWGVNYSGASYKFTVLDTNGIRRAQQVGQLAQTAYRALMTPYSYFGLGRTNNYVEALFVGTTKRRKENFVEIEGVIPNSQVMILPWEGIDGKGDVSLWEKQLYLSPGDWIPWVMVVLATIIVILLGVVFLLRQNEKKQDEVERKRAVHAINFDAL